MNSISRILLLLILCGAGIVHADDTPPPAGNGKKDTLGWYIVRPGDTLEGITVQFLGEKSLWRDNWRLNPSVRDPNRLRIGQRLRIIIQRQLPPRTAQILSVGGRVDQQPSPNPWIPAARGNLLKEEDGVRTHQNSSTQLEFDDRTRLTINESSLVFLREVSRSLGGVDREQIEVVEGQADIDLQPERADSTDVELILGEVRAAPKPGPSGRARSRLRQADEGGAQIMVYGGRTKVRSAGSGVDVPAGSGTTVAKDGRVGRVEKLLPTVGLIEPAAKAVISFANPLFSWKEVDGSAGYTLEVCRNRDCSELVYRKTGLKKSMFRPSELPQGRLFWRVTAVAPSGLDGYPSKTRPLNIDGIADRFRPALVLVPGPGLRAGETTLRGLPGASFRFAAMDEASGVASIRYRWDGGAWKQDHGKAIPLPSGSGEHILEAEALDYADRTSGLLHLRVVCEDEAPPAPELRSTRGEPSFPERLED